jgi:hypothetical protein
MASITQTIPQYSLGMSEQPDQLKFPGQVTEVTNAIPDITKGLYKRPGAKRIGTTPLPNVQTTNIGGNLTTPAGSWFHYYRDETEGSYIGQVAPDGQVRVWSCNDGQEMTMIYGETTWSSDRTYGLGDTIQSAANSGIVYIYEATGTITSTSRPTHTGGTVNNWQNKGQVKPTFQNYLQTANSENLQFLTINDTTFINNRDISNYTTAEINAGGTPSTASNGSARTVTTVGTTGTTDATPHTHFGFIELLRTENGRQYGVNINNSTATTTLTRATKIKITGHSFDEGDGSGHCPGIGTEVYAATAKGSYGTSENITDIKNSSGVVQTSGKENLTFRVTALGQQGVSPNYNADSSGPDGQNYRCSYNIEAVLLHGGEGWAVGDVVRVTPEHATEAANITFTGAAPNTTSSASQAYIDVTVTEVETTTVRATVASSGDGLIRPSPTPFDADTAVTADTILGGLKTQIDAISGVSCQIIGTGIYVFSDTQDFNLEVVEEDLMRCFQSSVNDVQNLPNQCKNGYIVKIANSRMSDEDDYYLRFEGEGGDGVGSWTECAEPGIAKTLTNMPLVLQRTDVNTFTIKNFTYADRRVGDDNTNPLPSFVGKRINKVLFFRNRLVFLSGENVVTSRPGTLGNPDFFAETALTVSASDPVDISAASTFPSELFDGIEVNTGLVVFSTNQQFLLAADDTVFNPDTAKLRSIATFNYNETIAPISLGTTVAYVDNSGKFSRFNEMANIQREGEPNVVEVSKVVPTLLPKNIDLLTNSRENSIVLMGQKHVAAFGTPNTTTPDSDTVYGYKYFQVSEQRQQAAWFKWKLNNPLVYHFIINDEYFFLDTDYFLQSIKLVQTETDQFLTQDNVDFLLHLDNQVKISKAMGSYNASTNVTTFSTNWLTDVSSPNYDLVVIDVNRDHQQFPTPDVGRYAKANYIAQNSVGTSTNSSFTLPGDWRGPSNVYLTVGYVYDYEVKFPTFYATRREGNNARADVNSSLVLHRIKFHFGKIGLYETTLERVGKTDYTEVYESTELDEYEASDAPYLEEFIKTVPVYEKNTNVDITLRSSHPAPATLRAVSWEGDYSPKYYKRV